LNTFEVTAETLFLTNPSGEWRHLDEPKWKKLLLYNFFPFSTQTHSRKNGEFSTSFSLSNKSTSLANKISYRKISEINVKKIKLCSFHFHCSEKTLTISVLWKNFVQKVVSAGKWRMETGFSAAFTFISLLFRYEI
jgi:hypothetical protein